MSVGTGFLRLGHPAERLSLGHHSGPGLRLVLWVQGCRLRCTQRCLNPHYLALEGGYLEPVDVVSESLLRHHHRYPRVEGVTVLGGEPFEQAEALAACLAPAKTAGLSVMVYSGHTLEALREAADPGVVRLLALCDILVDGPFISALYAPELVWRGSSNQRVLPLSDRYTGAQIDAAMRAQGRAVSISSGGGGDLMVSGAQDPASARALRRFVPSGRG